MSTVFKFLLLFSICYVSGFASGIFERSCKTRHPVVFIHGILGSKLFAFVSCSVAESILRFLRVFIFCCCCLFVFSLYRDGTVDNEFPVPDECPRTVKHQPLVGPEALFKGVC